MKKIIIAFSIIFAITSCSSEDTQFSYLEESKGSKPKINEHVPDYLEISYRGNTYSSTLDTTDSDAFFEDPKVEAIYRNIMKNSNIIINIKSNTQWELYDNEELIEKQDSDKLIHENENQTKAIPSGAFKLDDFAFKSIAYIYEHENMQGEMLVIDSASMSWWGGSYYIEAFNNFITRNFDDKMSSFQINNKSKYCQLEVKFEGRKGKSDEVIIKFIMQPNTVIAIPSVSKAYGKNINDIARTLKWSFKKAEGYDIGKLYVQDWVYGSRSSITQQPIPTIKNTKVYANYGYAYLFMDADIYGIVHDNIKLNREDHPNINNDDIIPFEVGLPLIDNNKLDLDQMSSNYFIFPGNSLQTHKYEKNFETTLFIAPRQKQTLELISKDSKMKLYYWIRTYSPNLNTYFTFKGDLEASVQDRPQLKITDSDID